MSSTLRELTEEYMALVDMADDVDVDEEVWRDTLEGIGGEIEVKADGYANVILELESKSAALKAETDRLGARRKSIDNSIVRIKKALEEAMRATGKVKFKTDLFSFNIQKNPASLKLADDIDVYSLPAEYVKFAAPEVDKAKVKEALKNGTELPWAHMEQSEGLRIR